jgi:hypothetical protein
MECKENRKFDLNNVPDKLPEEAWAILKKASDEKDLEDFREVGDRHYSSSLRAVPASNILTGSQGLLQGCPRCHFCRRGEEDA